MRGTRARGWAGRLGLYLGIMLITAAWANNVRHGTPPPTLAARISGAIFFSLIIAWGYWMERARAVVDVSHPERSEGALP